MRFVIALAFVALTAPNGLTAYFEPSQVAAVTVAPPGNCYANAPTLITTSGNASFCVREDTDEVVQKLESK